jgi:hypothetical protein
VYEDFSGYDVENEFFGDLAALQSSMLDAIEGNGQGGELAVDDIDSMNFWWGMKSKCAPNILLNCYCYGDPYEGARALDLAFDGLKPLMKKRNNGMASDPGYIGLSIANDHSQLDKYLEQVESDESYFEKDDIINSIKTDSKELQALVKYHKIKGLI